MGSESISTYDPDDLKDLEDGSKPSLLLDTAKVPKGKVNLDH
jgi:hypothetical protein